MSIKNALKILFNRFGIVGEILLFLLIFAIVFFGLGAIYIQPVIQAAVDLDLHQYVMNFYNAVFSGEGMEAISDSIKDIAAVIKNIFVNDNGIVFKTFIVPILVFVTFNLFSKMYELPLCKVLEGRMSSNAKLSLMNNVIGLSGKSALYVLVKLLFAIVSDIVILLAVWGSYKLILLTSMTLLIPFTIIFVLVLLLSLKGCFTITWEQHIIIGEKRIFVSFGKSVKDGFKHFGITFAGYFLSWIMVIAVNGLLALLTFGVGLIVSIPVSMLFFKLLQMTAYYKWNGKRYYLDGNRIVGAETELTDKLD